MKYIVYLSVAVMFSCYCFSQQNTDWFMIGRTTGAKVLSNGDTIRVFGFAQSLGAQPGVPGPTLIANEGDSVHLDFWNVSQGAPHTIHLHGLDVNQQNDGVPHLSFNVNHMEHGFYHFKAPHAGTYLYHCHVASTIHVQAGMYVQIIIRPPNGDNTTWDGGFPFVDEHSFFLSEIDTNWHVDSILDHEHDSTIAIHTVTIPKFEPQFFLVNGFSDQQLISEGVTFNSAVNQVDYTRLTNIGYRGVRVTFPPSLNARIVDSDGRPLPVEEISDTVYLYPGERYGVLTDPDIEFIGQITFDYLDLNTMNIDQTQVVQVNIEGFVDIEEDVVNEFSMKVVPNPFNQTTEIQFRLAEAGHSVHIKVYTPAANLIKSIELNNLNSGENSIEIGNGLDEKGLYFIELLVDGTVSGVRKMIKI